jgi:NAD+ synthase (glutamine-hydrolysing)
MRYGFVKVATCTPEVKVADTTFNTENIIKGINSAEQMGVELLCFPELCLTGATCGDLFFSEVLLSSALKGLKEIAVATNGKKMLVFVGLPFKYRNQIYNVSAALSNGKILGFIPKTAISNYGELSDGRYFSKAVFDGVVDFEAAVRRDDDPQQIIPEFDSGDHLHPSLAGAKQMAWSVPEEYFKN